jgi:peptidoglycan/LPS O-acetylase OafA/YrhL
MDWLRFFAVGRGLPVTLYAVFQIGALVCLRGRWRVAVSGPVLLLLLICANMAWSYPNDFNVWLMILLIAAPGAVLSIVLIWMAEIASRRRAVSAAGLGILCGLAIVAIAKGQHGHGGMWWSEWALGWTIITTCSLVGFGLVTSQLLPEAHSSR